MYTCLTKLGYKISKMYYYTNYNKINCTHTPHIVSASAFSLADISVRINKTCIQDRSNYMVIFIVNIKKYVSKFKLK